MSISGRDSGSMANMEHDIEHIGNKISSGPGMLGRATKSHPKEAFISLFNAMVLPLFDYCCCVWDGLNGDECQPGCNPSNRRPYWIFHSVVLYRSSKATVRQNSILNY